MSDQMSADQQIGSEISKKIITEKGSTPTNTDSSELNLFIDPNKQVQDNESNIEVKKASIEDTDNKPKPEVERDRFASKFAALTRKKRDMDNRERALAEKEQTLAAKIARLEELENDNRLLEERPLDVLKKRGVDFDKLTQMQLNEGNPTPEMMMSRMEEKFNSMLEERLGKLEETYVTDKKVAAEQRVDETINNFVEDITDFINDDSHGDKYELIRLQNAVPTIFEVIHQHYNETCEYDENGKLIDEGNVLSIEEASNHVEEYLEGQVKKLAAARKLGLTAKEAEKFVEDADNAQANKQSSNSSMTLSNAQSTTLPSSGERLLTREESLAKAASAIKYI